MLSVSLAECSSVPPAHRRVWRKKQFAAVKAGYAPERTRWG